MPMLCFYMSFNDSIVWSMLWLVINVLWVWYLVAAAAGRWCLALWHRWLWALTSWAWSLPIKSVQLFWTPLFTNNMVEKKTKKIHTYTHTTHTHTHTHIPVYINKYTHMHTYKQQRRDIFIWRRYGNETNRRRSKQMVTDHILSSALSILMAILFYFIFNFFLIKIK